MKMIVGLGNPGERYRLTRHNIGAVLIERFSKNRSIAVTQEKFSSRIGQGEVGRHKVLLQIPLTFMNLSGEAVSEALNFYKIPIELLLVVHDDIDLALGRMKLDFDAGAAGHKGVLSIIDRTGGASFYRLRLGIGRPARKEEVEGFVLSPFSGDEGAAVEEMLQEGEGQLEGWILKEEG